MRLRTLRIWKRWKPLWLLLAGWTVVSAVVLLFLGYSLFDLRGGLPRVDVASSQTITAEDVQAVHIYAEGAAVEVASSYDIGEIKIQLYGAGYLNQKAVWKMEEEGQLSIRLDPYPVIANAYGDRYEENLTMRILLPKKSYDEIKISGQRLDASFYQCKSRQLTADVDYGAIFVQKADVQKADFNSVTSEITIHRSRIHYLNIDNKEGNTNLLANTLRYWNYNSIAGDLDVLTDKIHGIWELNSRRGDIHVGTRKWHDNLLLELHSDNGTVDAYSKKKPWKETIPDALTAHSLELLEGRGENMLFANSKEGHILLDTVKFTQ